MRELVSDRYWWLHGWVPVCAAALALMAIAAANIDTRLANRLYFDAAAGQWLGQGGGDWWARSLIHQGGRDLVRGVIAATACAWIASYRLPQLATFQPELRFLVLGMLIAVTVVAALKSLTNVDCPWDLTQFGGTRPFVPLFADRPDSLPRAACFPGAHASSRSTLRFGVTRVCGAALRYAQQP
jgi:membrane-associated PAP2 superfamily phosphatase